MQYRRGVTYYSPSTYTVGNDSKTDTYQRGCWPLQLQPIL